MTADPNQIQSQYHGKRGALFSLAFVTVLLTAVTVGIYRFWAKTRIRRYIWSSVSANGDAFEYTGTGVEKLLGFLVAIVVLAIYLGIIQMILFYFGLTLFGEAETVAQQMTQIAAFYITFLAVVPLIFFAQYRARRYKLARTRWRGVRFGAEPGAWGYVLRACLHWLLTLITLGLLLPRQTYWLNKYKIDRTWFGDARFELQGKWTGLYPAMRQLFIGGGMVVLGGVLIALASAQSFGLMALGGILLFVGFVWFMVGTVSYRVRSFEYLARHTVLDNQVRFEARPITGTVVTTFLAGGLAAGALTGLVISIVTAVTVALLAMTGALMGAGAQETGVMQIAGLISFAALYVGALALSGGLMLVLVTQPILAHIVKSVTVVNFDALGRIRQRLTDKGADAEGFADALDVGGAF